MWAKPHEPISTRPAARHEKTSRINTDNLSERMKELVPRSAKAQERNEYFSVSPGPDDTGKHTRSC